MAFAQYENSNYDGKPVVLYEFRLGSAAWFYCGGESDLPFGGRTYVAMAVGHEIFSMSGNPTSDDFTINISANAEVTKLFNGTPPSEPIEVAVRTLHHGDTEAPVVWSGTVKAGRRVSMVEFSLNCNSLLATLNRNGLRLFWQRGCQHMLYDRLCDVDRTAFATTVQVTSLSGTSVSASIFDTFANGYFAGGYLSFVGAYGTTERRAIERHAGSTLHLLGASDGIAVGAWITAYPGCNRTSAMCEEKFNNLDNYGGFPHLPNKSPFDGDPVF